MPKTKVPKSVAKIDDSPKKKKYINKALVNDLNFQYDEDGLFTSRFKNNPTSTKISISSLDVQAEENIKTEKISIPNFSFDESVKNSEISNMDSESIDTDIKKDKLSQKTKNKKSKKEKNLYLENEYSYFDKEPKEEQTEQEKVLSLEDKNHEEILDKTTENLNQLEEDSKDDITSLKYLDEEPSHENEENKIIDNLENYESDILSKNQIEQEKEEEFSHLDSESVSDKAVLEDENSQNDDPKIEILADEELITHESSNQNQFNKEELNKFDNCIEMTGIRKTFGTTVANDLINLTVKKGTVHALIGENGAGKSTLMSILFGIYSPDSGIIKINGNITEISSPEQANTLGIGMVHQHFKQVDNMTVLQNIVLGSEIFNIWSGFINYTEDRISIMELMDKYNLKLNLSSLVSELSVSEQQKLEIIKVLYKRSDIIIFDEPTAVLSPNEIKDFLKLVKDLKNDGRTIIIISHKIPELKEVADEATIIRLGRTIKTFEMASLNNSEIAKLMVGREVKESKYPKNSHPYQAESILSVKDLVVHDSSKNIEKVKSVSFEVRAGEILGIAGVEGSGQKEIVDAISGLGKISSGSITINSRGVSIDISKASIKKRYDNGMAFIPEDRHKHGLVLDETVNNNISIRNVDKFSFWGFVNYSKIKKFGSKVCKDYDVRNSENGFAIARSLSGGNQQKVILGRELTSPSSFIVIFQPTRGLDVGSIEYVHSQIIEAKKQSKAILLVSYELEEIIGICDRVLVMNSGFVTGELNGENININNIGEKMIASSKEVS